jgi:hypothetical protein
MVSFVHQGQFSLSSPFFSFGIDTWPSILSILLPTQCHGSDPNIYSSTLTPSFHLIHRHQMPGLLQICDA